jgi:hypothetical protein
VCTLLPCCAVYSKSGGAALNCCKTLKEIMPEVYQPESDAGMDVVVNVGAAPVAEMVR